VAFSATEFWLNEKTGPLVRFTVKRDDAEPDAEEFWLNEIQAVLVTAATVTAAKVCRRPNACRAQSCQAATSVDGERKKGRGGPWVGALSGDPARRRGSGCAALAHPGGCAVAVALLLDPAAVL